MNITLDYFSPSTFGLDHGDEYHYIDDTLIRATTYKGVFGDMVMKTKGVLVFEDP